MYDENDELTESDLEFLNQWENMGKADTDSEYQPDPKDIPEPEGVAEGLEGELESDGDVEGELDSEGGDLGGDLKGDEMDESKMDLSDVETDEPQGNSDSDDDYAPEQDEELLDNYKQDTEPDHLEGGDTDSEIQDGEDDLEFDDNEELPDDPNLYENEDSDEQAEEDDGEGERGNSDEQRESDEPISDSDETEAELESENEKNEQELNAEGENDFEGDAQEELEQHLENNEPEQDSEQDEPESEQEPEGNKNQRPDTEGKFGDLPDADMRCENHCEDNEQESDDDEECPCCTERIKRERELWGVIAYDMHGKEILPGDKLQVKVPISFMVMGARLAANVPNTEVDPARLAESTSGTVDENLCWLSGKAISQFTGWHMQNAGAIWTFPKGKKIPFVQKLEQEIEHKEHGDNLSEGGQPEIEEMIEQLHEDLENMGGENQEKEPEEERLQEIEDNDLDRKDNDKKGLSKHHKERFENLTARFVKKIADTFGNTLESIEVEDIVDVDDSKYVKIGMKVVSRGMTFTFGFVARRYDIERDAVDSNEEEAA